MNAETRRAIEWEITQLMHRYANLNDVKDWPAVAALYTPDGVMWRPVAPDAPVDMPVDEMPETAPMPADLPQNIATADASRRSATGGLR